MSKVLGAFIVAALAASALASAGASGSSEKSNPYQGLYEKSVAGMGLPDQSLDGVLPPNAAIARIEYLAEAAQSRTCSQRCSTRCSVTCTTTRGCSSQCKIQTDGCGGVVTPAPAPPRTTTSRLDSAPAEAVSPTVYLIDGGSVYHASLTCVTLTGHRTVARKLSELGDGFEPCLVCKAPARLVASTGTAVAPVGTFALGATEEQVRVVQGTPTAVSGDSWRYEFSTVTFRGGRVVGYSDISGNLKVSLGQPTNKNGFWAIGATEAEVLAVQGTPTAVSGDSWRYEFSTVTFRSGRVVSYSNISSNLRVK